MGAVLGGWSLLQSLAQEAVAVSSEKPPALPDESEIRFEPLPEVTPYDADFRPSDTLATPRGDLSVTLGPGLSRDDLDVVVMHADSDAEHLRLPATRASRDGFPNLAAGEYHVALVRRGFSARAAYLLRERIEFDGTRGTCSLTGGLGELTLVFPRGSAPSILTMRRADDDGWSCSRNLEPSDDDSVRVELGELGNAVYALRFDTDEDSVSVTVDGPTEVPVTRPPR